MNRENEMLRKAVPVSFQCEVCLELMKASDEQVTLEPSPLLAAGACLCHNSESWEVAVSLLCD